MNKFKATENDSGRTILKFLESVLIGVPKSRIEKMFRNKDIKINGTRIKDKKYVIDSGDEIEVFGVRFTEYSRKNTKVKFEKVYEDENILIVDKPIGIEVHGPEDSLDNQVLSYLKFDKSGSFIPSHMGRIDKVTSGIVVYGKNYKTLRQLKEKSNLAIKIYRAKSTLNEDVIHQGKIWHDENDFKEVVNEKFGKDCITEFRVLDGEIEAQLITGRKHQIRATLDYLGHPILGDKKYGGKAADRVYLHSYKIVFNGLDDGLEYLNEKHFKTGPYFK